MTMLSKSILEAEYDTPAEAQEAADQLPAREKWRGVYHNSSTGKYFVATVVTVGAEVRLITHRFAGRPWTTGRA